LTPELEANFLRYLRSGHFLETACHLCGFTRSVVYEWLSRGARGDGLEYERFHMAVCEAMAQAEDAMLTQLEQHGRNHWQVLAWRFERRVQGRWGKRERLDVPTNSLLITYPATSRFIILQ
jgi:hypothetical protein